MKDREHVQFHHFKVLFNHHSDCSNFSRCKISIRHLEIIIPNREDDKTN